MKLQSVERYGYHMAIASVLSSLNLNSILPEKLKKAKIEVLGSNGKKTDEVEVLFNPSQYMLSDSASYSEQETTWKDSPLLNYKGGRASTLSMELFFDTSPVLTTSLITSVKAEDVSKKVKKFTDLVYIQGSQHAPPKVKFVWGSLSFYGVVVKIDSTYTKFTEDGMPIQAKLKVSFKSAPDKNQKRKSPFESPDRTKCRTVREDYTIWDMAQNEYGDVSKWKVIANANRIANPLDIPVGTILKIPAL